MKKRNLNRFRREDDDIHNDFSCPFETLSPKNSSEKECKSTFESLFTFYGYKKTVTIVEGNLIDGRQDTD